MKAARHPAQQRRASQRHSQYIICKKVQDSYALYTSMFAWSLMSPIPSMAEPLSPNEMSPNAAQQE